MASRILSGAIVVIVILYWALRFAAQQCSGAACDWFIPFSLFLPIIAILVAVGTAFLAAFEQRARRWWAFVIGACGILASVGSILVAFVLTDNETKVVVATVFVLSVPVAVWISAVTHPTTIS